MPTVNDITATEDFFGDDVYFTDDLQMTAAGDYAIASEEQAIRQGIYHRIITRPGEFKVRPNYGIGAQDYVKKSTSKAHRDELRQKILDGLAQDKRLDKIIEVVIEALTLNGRPGFKIYIKAQIQGRARTLQPFVVSGFDNTLSL